MDYVATLYVGNPPQQIRAIFDTGSSNTWILNKNTSLDDGDEKLYSYDDTVSNSSLKTSQQAFINFASGELSGNFF